MTAAVSTSTNVLAILPEILLLALGLLVLLFDLLWPEERRRDLGWLVAGGLLVILVLSLAVGRPAAATPVFGGMLRFDWLAFVFKMLFLVGGIATALFLMDSGRIGRHGQAYMLLLASLLGMCLMASAADLVMLYLAIETTSIPLYVLAGFLLTDDRSTEAGFKYLLFGAMTSAILLYGFSLVYGLTGTTSLYELGARFSAGLLSPAAAFGVLALVLAGLAFKVSLFPFHFWAPDVYHGAPTPVAGFLSTASKAAGFAVVLRLLLIAFAQVSLDWAMILAVLSVLTMTVGNLLALAQKNIKRLLAYSSIAHAGYAMIGVVAMVALHPVTGTPLGATSVVFYLIAYLITNLAAFGIVAAFGRLTGSDELPDYAGLSRRSAGLALFMLVAFLSLAGMPPFAGFVAKVFVFAAAMQTGWWWLAVAGVLNSIIGLYYYLTVLKVVYLHRMPGEDEEKHPLPLTRPYTIALTVLTIGILLLGAAFAPWFGFGAVSAASLF